MPLRALLYRRPTEPQAIEVVCDGAVHLVRLRRHRQARRYTLRVVAVTREAVLTIPPRGSFREAREFAEKHGAWIAARLDRLPRAAPFKHGVEIPLRGVVHTIAHRRGARGTVWTEIDRDGRRMLCVAGHAEHVARRITRTVSASRCDGFRSATRRAGGAHARPPARCRFRGGWCWRHVTCSITWRPTKWPTSWR